VKLVRVRRRRPDDRCGRGVTGEVRDDCGRSLASDASRLPPPYEPAEYRQTLTHAPLFSQVRVYEFLYSTLIRLHTYIGFTLYLTCDYMSKRRALSSRLFQGGRMKLSRGTIE